MLHMLHKNGYLTGRLGIKAFMNKDVFINKAIFIFSRLVNLIIKVGHWSNLAGIVEMLVWSTLFISLFNMIYKLILLHSLNSL